MISRSMMDLAISVARDSPSRKQVGAILLQKNRVVSQGVNIETKTHPRQAKFARLAGLHEKIYLHAEMHALIKCKFVADTIVVVRLGGHNHNELRNAKPCPVCSLALAAAGIQNIIYTTDDGFVVQHP